MARQKPIVRYFIVCDRVEQSPDGRQVSLINLISTIRALPNAPYPRIHPGLWLFAQMTDGLGPFDFSIQLVNLDDDRSIFVLPPVKLDLGQNPLAVRGWAKRLLNVLFEKPGMYEFRLLCDGDVIASAPIRLR